MEAMDRRNLGDVPMNREIYRHIGDFPMKKKMNNLHSVRGFSRKPCLMKPEGMFVGFTTWGMGYQK